ncbi:MAG: class I SAM-dependent methyltransferase [Gemmatimonadetes bacterium]|nr:class I SAM-dependent methyltransferase [Gemmatimonadota bacterium]
MSGAGTITGYRDRTYALVRDAMRALGPIATAVDVGAGEGWYAQALMRDGVITHVTPVEVQRRATVLVEPLLYDGTRLPFDDGGVDLVYAVDVVHHAHDPFALLADMARVARRWLVLKDHTYASFAGRATLAVMDEIGNRRFGIPSPGRYQHAWDWIPALERVGFRPRSMLHPAPCHGGLMGALTNRLQFVAAFERTDAH